MRLKQAIEQQFIAIVARGGCAPGGEQMTFAGHNGAFEAELTAADTIACAFLDFALRTDVLDNSSIDELKKVSEDLSSRINYLLEPISPIEIDSEGCLVQMRSNPPQKDDDGTSYYELNVRRGEISLKRFGKPKGGARTVIPAQVTNEVFIRLAQDFDGVVATK